MYIMKKLNMEKRADTAARKKELEVQGYECIREDPPEKPATAGRRTKKGDDDSNDNAGENKGAEKDNG